MPRRSISAVAGLATALAAGLAAGAPVAQTDFLNFTYDVGLGDTPEKVTVTDGEYTRVQPDDRLFFQVRKVVRGDVNGDDRPDALVITSLNTGGTGYFSDGLVFVDAADGPKVIATLGIGDRADGGIYDARIARGRIVVERFRQVDTGACCPTQIDTTVLELTPNGLRRVGTSKRRAYMFAGNGTRSAPARLKFLPGTSNATIEGDGFRNERIVFDASRGQRVTIAVRKPAGRVSGRVSLVRDGVVLGRISTGARRSITLPATGNYSVRFAATQGNRRVDDGVLVVDITIT